MGREVLVTLLVFLYISLINSFKVYSFLGKFRFVNRALSSKRKIESTKTTDNEWIDYLSGKVGKSIKGVGPKASDDFKRLGIDSVRDLLLHFPSNILDRSKVLDLATIRNEKIMGLVTVCVTVNYLKEGFGSNRPHIIFCSDNSSSQVEKLQVTFFRYSKVQWTEICRKAIPGNDIIISGKGIMGLPRLT